MSEEVIKLISTISGIVTIVTVVVSFISFVVRQVYKGEVLHFLSTSKRIDRLTSVINDKEYSTDIKRLSFLKRERLEMERGLGVKSPKLMKAIRRIEPHIEDIEIIDTIVRAQSFIKITENETLSSNRKWFNTIEFGVNYLLAITFLIAAITLMFLGLIIVISGHVLGLLSILMSFIILLGLNFSFIEVIRKYKAIKMVEKKLDMLNGFISLSKDDELQEVNEESQTIHRGFSKRLFNRIGKYFIELSI